MNNHYTKFEYKGMKTFEVKEYTNRHHKRFADGRSDGFVCLFCCFTSKVNSYGHGGMVSSPNHTFFQGKFELAVNQYLVHMLSLVTDNNPS